MHTQASGTESGVGSKATSVFTVRTTYSTPLGKDRLHNSLWCGSAHLTPGEYGCIVFKVPIRSCTFRARRAPQSQYDLDVPAPGTLTWAVRRRGAPVRDRCAPLCRLMINSDVAVGLISCLQILCQYVGHIEMSGDEQDRVRTSQRCVLARRP